MSDWQDLPKKCVMKSARKGNTFHKSMAKKHMVICLFLMSAISV